MMYTAWTKTQYRNVVTSHVYKVLLSIWILLGLASCASVLTTVGDTYSAIMFRLQEKAIELKEMAEDLVEDLVETIAEKLDDSESDDSEVPQPQPQPEPPPSRPASRSKNRVAPVDDAVQSKPQKY